MQRGIVIAVTVAIAAIPVPTARAQQNVASESERQAVVRAALDYMEGALDADADRVARGVHPELTKVTVTSAPQGGGQYLGKSGSTQLIEIVRARVTYIVPEARNITTTVFDIGNDLAVAKVVSSAFYDYLQLAKIDGQWRIVNVLWAHNAAARDSSIGWRGTTGDEAGVRACALDYIDGAFSGSAERMARALHPELTKVVLFRLPQTGRYCLGPMGAQGLIVSTGLGLMNLPAEQRGIEVTVYDVAYDIATVKVISSQYIDYLQIARVDGEWKIINVLWVPNTTAGRED